ncbi:MAG TPA: carbon-nitrogen hydrolase family protein [Vicinamibacterales bacterium]|nr:carbon-nitrogen hydrolase family protein [Vicinamibacterales bacterium]
MTISRRSLLVGVAATGAAAVVRAAQRPVRVAAIQIHPTLADVSANLERAERLIREAIAARAKWIVLPEFFTSGLAFDPVNLPNAPRPIDGAPMQMLKHLAKAGDAAIGGAFLARSGRDVFNTFALALPTGDVFTHDKDFPTTSMESSLYAGGEDDEFVKEIEKKGVATEHEIVASRADNIKSGVFHLPSRVSVGVAMCWEQVRYRTARRMRSQVDLVLTASGWPAGGGDPKIVETPRRLARLVGAPVIHASIVGPVPSAGAPDGTGSRTLQFSGESQIVDGSGKSVASRHFSEGEGVLIGDIDPGRVTPSEAIPDATFWTPEGPGDASTFWQTSGAAGRALYLKRRAALVSSARL